MSDVDERDVDDLEVSSEVLDAAHDTTDATDEAATSRPRSGGSTAWIAWTLVAALAVVAAVAVVQWRSVAGPVEAAQAAREAAVDYVLTLSTWDASSGLEPTYAALVAGATDEFVPEVDEVFGDEQREELVAVGAVSTGTIEDVMTGGIGVAMTGGIESRTVPVVVVVRQFVVTGPTADPAARTERVALLRMTEQAGTWLVDDLEMLSELQLAEEDQ